MSNLTNTTLVEEATSPIGLHLVGMGFAALSSLCSTTGILMQKHSAHVEAGRHLCFCGAGGTWKWRFWLGFTINTGSEAVLSTVALYFTPLSLIAPLGGLSVIFNALLTRFGCVFGIKEVMTRNGWIATLVVLAGVTLVSMSGPGSDGDGAPIKIEDFRAIVLDSVSLKCFLGSVFEYCRPHIEAVRVNMQLYAISTFLARCHMLNFAGTDRGCARGDAGSFCSYMIDYLPTFAECWK